MYVEYLASFIRILSTFIFVFCSTTMAISYHRRRYNRDCEASPRTNDQPTRHSHGFSWSRGKFLGKGGYGSVFLATKKVLCKRSKFPHYMAVKSATMEKSKSLMFEKDILSNLSDTKLPCFVKFYGHEVTYTDKKEQVYNLLMEYCSEGSLLNRVKTSNFGLPEDEVQLFTRDIVNGLCYIHRCGIIHCDIKLDNILLTKAEDGSRLVAKLVDFGLARIRSIETDDKIKGTRGTWRYMSPELVCELKLEAPSDIWALGCSVLEMLTGEPMWNGINGHQELEKMISNCRPDTFEFPKRLTTWARDFIENCCLVREVNYRWSAEQLLEHPFLCF